MNLREMLDAALDKVLSNSLTPMEKASLQLPFQELSR
jgi:hypothetical protein